MNVQIRLHAVEVIERVSSIEISKKLILHGMIQQHSLCNRIRRPATCRTQPYSDHLHQSFFQNGQSEWNGSGPSDEIGNNTPDEPIDDGMKSVSSKTDEKLPMTAIWLVL
jgi:hypothetical protein